MEEWTQGEQPMMPLNRRVPRERGQCSHLSLTHADTPLHRQHSPLSLTHADSPSAATAHRKSRRTLLEDSWHKSGLGGGAARAGAAPGGAVRAGGEHASARW